MHVEEEIIVTAPVVAEEPDAPAPPPIVVADSDDDICAGVTTPDFCGMLRRCGGQVNNPNDISVNSVPNGRLARDKLPADSPVPFPRPLPLIGKRVLIFCH